MNLKCVKCVEKYLSGAQQAKAQGDEIEVRDADTLIPSWQQLQVGPQMMFACVALPMCIQCIEAGEKEAKNAPKRVPGAGLLIPGSLG